MSSFDNLTYQQQYICDLVSICCAGLSLICSVTTLWLIFALKKRNGYVLLISSLCMSELIYDVSCCLSFSHAAWLCKLKNAGIFVGGIGVSVWSLIIAAVVLYMVTYLQPVRISNMYPLYFLLAVIVPMILAFYDFDNEFKLHCGGGGTNEESWNIGLTYTYGRVVCLVLSMIVYALTSYKSYLMRQVTHATASQSIETLCGRMKYYVLVQVFIRLVPTYTQVIQPHSPFFLQLISSICAPLSGLGYFIVFMSIHPGAARLFLGYFRCVELVPLRRAGGEAEGVLSETVRGSLVEGHEVTLDCALVPVCVLEWLCCYCHEMGAITDAASEEKHRFVGRYSASSRSRRPGSGRDSDSGSDVTVSLLADASLPSSSMQRGGDLGGIEEGDEESVGASSLGSGAAGFLIPSPEGSRFDSASGEGILLSRSEGNYSLEELVDAVGSCSHEGGDDDDERDYEEEHSVISHVSAADGYSAVPAGVSNV